MKENKTNIYKDIFLERANKIHGKKYLYDQVNYINANTKVEIKCKIHGIFFQTPDNHTRLKTGCPKCKGGVKFNKQQFIERAIAIHGDLYDYSQVEYENNHSKIKIICFNHGIFMQTPNDHLTGYRCFKCGKEIASSNKTLTKDEFISKSNKIHNNVYNYIIEEFHGTRYKVKIQCKEHGVFIQKANSHLNGSGCPKCKISIGERKIITFLLANNVQFEFQKRFKECCDKRTLPFDFYLPKYNLCIEFDGRQHFIPHDRFDTPETFSDRQRKDEIKTNFCKENQNPNLLRIKYSELHVIDDVLKQYLSLF